MHMSLPVITIAISTTSPDEHEAKFRGIVMVVIKFYRFWGVNSARFSRPTGRPIHW